MTELFLKVESAEQTRDDSVDVSDAICNLSQNYVATAVLLKAYREYILAAESQWREIEQRDDFKAKYTSREDARMDFLKFYFTKGAKK